MVVNVFEAMKHQNENLQCCIIDIVEETIEETSKGRSSLSPLDNFIVNSVEDIEEDQD